MMNMTETFLFIFDLLLVVLLASVRAINLLAEIATPFSLKQRIKEGDAIAQQLEKKQAVIPRLITLQHMAEIIAVVAIAIVSVSLLGWLLGGLMAVGLVLISEIIMSRQWFRSMVQQKFHTVEQSIVTRVERWGWLDVISSEIPREDVKVYSKPELLDLIGRSQGIISHDEQKHIQNALLFSDVKVADIMTPRSMIESIDEREGIGPLVMDQLHKTGHSRFPVTDGDIDHVVGMLYLHDLITLHSAHKTVKGAMQPRVYYIREDHDLEHALHAFLRTHHHLFIVINKYRETVGLLSLEDVIEYLLGRQVVDEFDEYDDIRKVAESNPRRSNEPKGKINL